MRIGLLLPSLLNTKKFSDRIFAPGELFTDLARSLAARGHEVTVYSSIAGVPRARVVRGAREFEERLMPGTRDYGKDNPVVHRFFVEARNRSEYEIEFLSRAIADANVKKLDIIHSYFGELAHYFVPYARMPMVFTIHDPVFKKHTLEHWRFSHFRNHNYILISRSQEREYVSAFGFPHREVILHGAHIEKFPFVPRSKDYLVLIGRYMAQKGFVEAMKIARDLKKELHIASSPNYREFSYYKNEMRPLLKSPYIVERGHLSVSGRNRYVGGAKAFLFPLKWPEPFGMVVIEAMALGTPVVAFAEGALPEIIEDGKTGFLVKRSAGIAGLKKAVSRIYAMSAKEYEAMRRACREHVEKHFSTERMAKDHEKAYRRFIKRVL